MGTWGHGNFDNDGAHDWLDELHDKGVAAIRSVLGRVARAKYSDVDDAQAALAAAEVVAAARGNPRPGRQPDLLAVWVDDHSSEIVDAHAELAAKAVARVRESSELRELWDAEAKWVREIEKLIARLGAKAKRVRVKSRKNAARARTVFEPSPTASVRSPNRSLTATVVGHDVKSCYVIIEARNGGGSVFAAECRYDAIAMRWLDDATLEITYPKRARLDQHDPTWQFRRRRVACVYRPIAPRTRRT
ncbi:MAG: DUF4259 domain-containing protein [Kofleriaceae bacterium]|nr:DUF4259 domain-containing protein [Kofleriaceae bacterium]